jgi:hypothetical protein
MGRRTWWTLLAIISAGITLATTGPSRAQANGGYQVYSNDPCVEDDCGSGRCSLGLCRKFRAHGKYFTRGIQRPYVRVRQIPPELAPYVSGGSYYSSGYGIPMPSPYTSSITPGSAR